MALSFAERSGPIGERAKAEADPTAAAQMLGWQAAIQTEAEARDPFSTPAELRWVELQQIRDSDLAPYMPLGMSIHYRPVVPPFPLPSPASSEVVPLLRR